MGTGISGIDVCPEERPGGVGSIIFAFRQGAARCRLRVRQPHRVSLTQTVKESRFADRDRYLFPDHEGA